MFPNEPETMSLISRARIHVAACSRDDPVLEAREKLY